MLTRKKEAELRARRAFPVNGLARRAAEFHWLVLVLVLAFVLIPSFAVREADDFVMASVAYAALVLVMHYLRQPASTVRGLMGDVWLMVAYIGYMMWQAGESSRELAPLFLLPAVVTAVGHTRRLAFVNVVMMCLVMAGLAWPRMAGPGWTTALAGILVYGFTLAVVANLIGGYSLGKLLATRQLRRLMDRDELTGLLNMPAFSRLAAPVYQNCRRGGLPVSLILVDVHRLAAINDAHGLEAGNRVLQSVAKTVQRTVRDSDLAARLGGDEMILLLPTADRVRAEEVGQRIRNGVNQTTLELGNTVGRASVHVGVATYSRDGEALSELIQAATQAMRRDKALRIPAARA